jgi:hypothetical protein
MAKRKIVMSEFNHIFILIIILCLIVIGMSIYGPVYKMIESFQNKPEEKTPIIPITIDAAPVIKTNGTTTPVVPTLPKVSVMTPKTVDVKLTAPLQYNPNIPLENPLIPTAKPAVVPESKQLIVPESKPVVVPVSKPVVVPEPKIIAPIPVAKEVKPTPKRLDISESSQTRFMPKTMLQPSYVPSDEIISAKQPVQQIVEQPTEQPIQKQDKSKLLSIFKFNF